MNFKVKAVRAVVAAGLALVTTTGVAFASIGSATVTADSLRLRSTDSTTSTTLAQAPKGSTVTVEEKAGDGWYKVTYDGKTGYMSGDWLTVSLNDGTVLPAAQGTEPELKRGVVNTAVLNVRSGAGTNYEKVGSLRSGATVDILADLGNGWYQIESGYISAEYIKPVSTTVKTVSRQAAGSTANANVSVNVGGDGSASSLGASALTVLELSELVHALEEEFGASAAAMAKSLLGCRYRSGGAGPSAFDCSGLMYYIYQQLGYPIARGSSSQYYNSGYFVSLDAMQPGDLIFFFDSRFDGSGGTLPTTHVGMYVGGGQFIHASTTSYRVQYDSVSGYYSRYIVGAKRIG